MRTTQLVPQASSANNVAAFAFPLPRPVSIRASQPSAEALPLCPQFSPGGYGGACLHVHKPCGRRNPWSCTTTLSGCGYALWCLLFGWAASKLTTRARTAARFPCTCSPQRCRPPTLMASASAETALATRLLALPCFCGAAASRQHSFVVFYCICALLARSH